jgi:DNA-binding HxlR family transcriptional regulator
LSLGLHHLGERWTVAILMGAFVGVRRFDGWLSLLGIPRATLSSRLHALCELGVLERNRDAGGYRLTTKGLALYDAVLMVWLWEQRFGGRDIALPSTLVHTRCGHSFTPELVCSACRAPAHLHRLQLDIIPPAQGAQEITAAPARQRGARMGGAEHTTRMGLGLRVDRWALLTIAAVMLSCQHFGELQGVLGMGSAVLSRRLTALVDSGLLQANSDDTDARKRRYALTTASHALLGYIVCLDHWSATQLPNCHHTIAPRHADCGKAFVPQTACNHCHGTLLPREVRFPQELKVPEEITLST